MVEKKAPGHVSRRNPGPSGTTDSDSLGHKSLPVNHAAQKSWRPIMSEQISEPTPTNPLCLDFEGNLVRFVGTQDRLEWVAPDACAVLGIKNTSQALQAIPAKHRGLCKVYTSSGTREVLTVYEPGLYRLISRSNKPAAARFQDWLFEEVLPCIRKYGTYPAPPTQPSKSPPPAIQVCPYTKRMSYVRSIEQMIPRGHWCVFIEGTTALMKAQELYGDVGAPMGELDLMDGSIGTRYTNYRKDKDWACERVKFEYKFPPGDPRGTVFPWAYPMAELQYFRVWLLETYWPVWFPVYVEGHIERNHKKDERYAKLLPAVKAMKALAASAK